MNSLTLRNCLNTVFIFGAIAGMIVYYQGQHETGGIIIIVAMAFKFIEVSMRLLKKNEE